MVATLLEERGHRLDGGPGLGESLAVFGLAVRTRLATTAPARTVAAGNAARGIALFGLTVYAITAVEHLAIWLDMTVNGYPQTMTAAHTAVLLIGYLAVPAAFTAVMLGRIRLARVLGVIALAPGAIGLSSDGRLGHWTVFITEATADVALWLAVACLFLAATRALRRASPLWWCAVAIAVVLGTLYELMPSVAASMNESLWLQFFRDTALGWVVALGCLGYLAVARRRFYPAGSAALTMSAAALVTLVAQIDELVVSSEQTWGLPSLAPLFAVFVGLTGLLLAMVVAMAAVGIRRYWSLGARRGITGLG